MQGGAGLGRRSTVIRRRPRAGFGRCGLAQYEVE